MRAGGRQARRPGGWEGRGPGGARALLPPRTPARRPPAARSLALAHTRARPRAPAPCALPGAPGYHLAGEPARFGSAERVGSPSNLPASAAEIFRFPPGSRPRSAFRSRASSSSAPSPWVPRTDPRGNFSFQPFSPHPQTEPRPPARLPISHLCNCASDTSFSLHSSPHAKGSFLLAKGSGAVPSLFSLKSSLRVFPHIRLAE